MDIKDLYKIYLSHSLISTDTRDIKKDCIFFALKGDSFNGNKFARNAITNGASFAIIDEKEYKVSENYILVDNVLETLQKLANYHRKQLKIPFIGITGTNGKTTTKEFIHAILSKKYKTSATVGNLNNHIGVPLTLLSIDNNCEIAIIEMGANHEKEIEFLCKIAEPNYGIITNIGTAHIEGFGDYNGVKRTKNELYKHIKSIEGKVFLNQNDSVLTALAKDINQITYGDTNAICNAKLTSSTPSVKLKWNKEIITSKLYGKYNFENILAAICIGNYFEVSSKDIKEAIEEYTPTNNRSQIEEINSNVLFLDAYNANPTSMNAAIDTFSENNSKNKLMILGDMLELGESSQKEHEKVVEKVSLLKLDALFVGKEFKKVSEKNNFTFLSNVNEVIDWFKQTNLIDHQILIKGSRGIKLESIVDYLKGV